MASTAHEHGAHEIHLPRPTFWPMLAGLGFMMLPLGFIVWQRSSFSPLVGQGVMGGGFVLLLIAIFGWVISGIQERIRTREAPLGGAEAAKLAMWLYLGTETIIFGGLIAHAVFLWIRDTDINHALHALDALLIVSVNTFFLLTSSLCVVLGLTEIQKDNRAGLARWLGATAFLGAIFLGIQAYEYSKLVHEGITITSSQFGMAFFFLTGFHGLHVLVGVLWALVLVAHTLRGGFSQPSTWALKCSACTGTS
jgi:Heme/copper-type cytochrome/quinol oxidase, subunit 3